MIYIVEVPFGDEETAKRFSEVLERNGYGVEVRTEDTHYYDDFMNQVQREGRKRVESRRGFFAPW